MDNNELRKEAFEKVKETVMSMNGLSEEGFSNRYRNDPYFHRGFTILVELFMESKFSA